MLNNHKASTAPSLAQCLFDTSDINTIRWSTFNNLRAAEVCLKHIHNQIDDFSASVVWFQKQGFSVITSQFERSEGTFKALRAQWEIPSTGEKTPLTGFRAWARSFNSIGGLSIGLDFAPSGSVISVKAGHSRK